MSTRLRLLAPARCWRRWARSAPPSTKPSSRPSSPIPSNCRSPHEAAALMLLEVRHVTQYHYAETVRESVMEVWMQPQKLVTQRLVSFELEVEPPAQLFSYADNFGNAVYHFDVPQPHDRLTIVARSAVETQAPELLPERLDRGEWDRLKSDFVRGENFDFLTPHGFAAPTRALRAFVKARRIDALARNDPLSAVHDLNTAISEAFEYETD